VEWASVISLTLTRLVHLHLDPLALRAPPFSLLVVDVPFEFLHGDFALLAGHDALFVSMIALPYVGRKADSRTKCRPLPDSRALSDFQGYPTRRSRPPRGGRAAQFEHRAWDSVVRKP